MTVTEGKHAGGQEHTKHKGKHRLKSLIIGVSVAAVLAGAGPVSAQPSGPPAQTVTEEARIAFDIPAQSLESAVTAFGFQSGYQVAVDQATLTGLRGNEVRGSFTPAEALRRLLAGTGVTYRLIDENSVTLIAASTDGTDDGVIQLDPVLVEGQAESAYGPVQGYVAKRSATTTKTDTPLIETPQSISIVTADQIEDLKPQTVAESLRYSPGIRVETLGVQPATDTYVLRGFSETVGNVYQDGLRRAGGSFFGYDPIEPYGLERVETFRGPTSVLYGQNGPGGLINVVTKRPPRTPIREIELRGGSFDSFQGTFDVGGPIGKNKQFGYRLTGLVRDSETQVDFVDNNRQFIAGAFSWRPSDDTSLTILADYINHDGQFIGAVPAAAVLLDNPNGAIHSNRFIGEPGYDEMTNERYSVAYLFEHEFSDALAVRQNLRYGHFDVDRKFINGAGLQADQRTLNRNAFATFQTGDVFTVDNQLEATFETGSISHKVLVGADYIYRKYDTNGAFGGGGVAPIDIFNPVYGAPVATQPITFSPLQKDNQFGLICFDLSIVNFGFKDLSTLCPPKNNLLCLV